jgi:hypothetical protein
MEEALWKSNPAILLKGVLAVDIRKRGIGDHRPFLYVWPVDMSSMQM